MLPRLPARLLALILYCACWSSPVACGQSGTAVVIGVSNYQDAGVADLRFAHRDAEAFAAYLQAAGLETRLLVDSAATLAAITSALSWQRGRAEARGPAIVYFAGHGDREVRNDAVATGYLLAYDTPANNYPLTALGLDDLDRHLSELSKRGCPTLLISDACHAGALAGSTLDGSTLTSLALLNSRGGEARLLACRPEELSLEGPQWGGGRGVFSYYLTEGLAGRADRDGNQRSDLFEVEQFVKTKVRRETRAQQTPVVTSGIGEFLMPVVANPAEGKELRFQDLEEQFVENYLALLPAGPQQAYVRFERARRAGRLLVPAEASADSFYRSLVAEPKLSRIRDILRERFIVNLLDPTQVALQRYLETDQEELYRRARSDRQYSQFIAYLERAAELIDQSVDRERYEDVVARLQYFRAVRLRTASELAYGVPDSVYQAALDTAGMALALRPNLAYVHNERGLILLRLDSLQAALDAFDRAAELAPTWAIPYNNRGLSYKLMGGESNFAAAITAYERAIELKPAYTMAYNNLANVIEKKDKNLNKAKQLLRQAIGIDPNSPTARYNLARVVAKDADRLEEAIAILEPLVEDYPDNATFVYLLGYLNAKHGRIATARQWFQRTIELDPDHASAYQYLYYLDDQALGEVDVKFYKNQITSTSNNFKPYLGWALADRNDPDWLSSARDREGTEFEKYAFVAELAHQLVSRSALRQAERALLILPELLPEDPRPYLELAYYFDLTKEKEKTINALRSMLVYQDKVTDFEYCHLFEATGAPFYELIHQKDIQRAISKFCN